MFKNSEESEDSENLKAKNKVYRYYKAATEDYLRYYQSAWHHHMHYGFDRDLPRGGNPTENLVQYLAHIAGVDSNTRVLDSGCGVGGSAIWLSRNLGATCIGITLMELQAKLAAGFAAKKAVGHQARFLANDFTLPAFKAESFDVIWAIESFDHAPDKKAFVNTMFGLLRPGGKLLVADGFKTDVPFSPKQARAYEKFLEGWAVPHLCTSADFKDYARQAGFQAGIGYHENITRDIRPHAFAIYRFGLLFMPLRWLGWKLGLTCKEKLGNAIATYYQYHALNLGLWSYEIFCCTKPLIDSPSFREG